MTEFASEAERREILERFGARGAVADELLEYNRNVFDTAAFSRLPQLPLPDEEHVATWREYVAECRRDGVLEALSRRLVQLAFPVREGISESEEYRAGTRKGQWPTGSPGLELERPELLEVEIHETQAGAIPVVVAPWRADFESLVQAFIHRNEPRPVPASMGACIVSGLNNWDRIAAHRRAFEARGGALQPGGWSAEFKRLIPQKGKYQDRFIVLSTGEYSAVAAEEIGLEAEEWSRRSLIIRREHECTHYFTLRVLGSMRNNLIDELIADYVGLVAAFGHYSPEAAQRFFGIGPFRRQEGRIHNYRGDPPLSDAAFAVLEELVMASVEALAALNSSAADTLRRPEAVARTILTLAARTVEELAGGRCPTAEEILS